MTEIVKQQSLKHQTKAENLPTAAVTYKDRIFRMLFKEKKEFLELYNAMNSTKYSNPNDLIVTTLDNAIYMGMKNDVSFLLYDKLTLYEHQSTNNPSIPLRNLLYVADLYSNLTKDKNLYGTKLIKIPEPKFVVFYNGVSKTEEQFTLKLSDMFETTPKHTSLELETQVFNINLGYNRELMEKCQSLHDYAIFVDLVRKYQQTMALETAIGRAINECIANNVLAEFLKRNKAEVLKMGIYEYNEEEHMQMEREDAREEGIQAERLRLIEAKILKGKSLETIADELEQNVDEIRKIYELIKQNEGAVL